MFEKGKRVIVTGKGVGFNTSSGDAVDLSKVEKKYYAPQDMSTLDLATTLMNADERLIEALNEVIPIETQENRINHERLFFPVLDHLMNAIELMEIRRDMENPLQWEIKNFYPKEYQWGMKIVQLVRKKLGIELPNSEAAFLALHFLNAQIRPVTGEEVYDLTEITKSITKIVKYYFNINFNEESIGYNRFITHIKYFLFRQIRNEPLIGDDTQLASKIIEEYPNEKACVQLISDYIQQKKGWEISESEMMYLIIHIRNITNETCRNRISDSSAGKT